MNCTKKWEKCTQTNSVQKKFWTKKISKKYHGETIKRQKKFLQKKYFYIKKISKTYRTVEQKIRVSHRGLFAWLIDHGRAIVQEGIYRWSLRSVWCCAGHFLCTAGSFSRATPSRRPTRLTKRSIFFHSAAKWSAHWCQTLPLPGFYGHGTGGSPGGPRSTGWPLVPRRVVRLKRTMCKIKQNLPYLPK